MKKDRLYDILETMKKNPSKVVMSHFGALSDHSAVTWCDSDVQQRQCHVTRQEHIRRIDIFIYTSQRISWECAGGFVLQR